jgi:hypothetical protein
VWNSGIVFYCSYTSTGNAPASRTPGALFTFKFNGHRELAEMQPPTPTLAATLGHIKPALRVPLQDALPPPFSPHLPLLGPYPQTTKATGCPQAQAFPHPLPPAPSGATVVIVIELESLTEMQPLHWNIKPALRVPL